MSPQEHVQLDVRRTGGVPAEGLQIDLDQEFDIDIESRSHPFSIAGMVLHILGLALGAATLVVLLAGGPDAWFGTNDAALRVKEWIVALGLFGLAFLLSGLALHTYGRSVHGGEELEVAINE